MGKHEQRYCPYSAMCGMHGNIVSGFGNESTGVMLIGEAPGRDEDTFGVPFCGMAGKELDNYLSGVDLVRSNLYITNLVRCRPPQNRDPLKLEIDMCSSFYLTEEIQRIKPSIIGALGRISSGWLLGEVDMEHVHGIPYFWRSGAVKSIVVPMYHPAAGLHNPMIMIRIRQDFEALAMVIRGKIRPRVEAREEGEYNMLTGEEVRQCLRM